MQIGKIRVGLDAPLFVIAGPCVIESEEMTLNIARALNDIGEELSIPIIFKASYDKANRSSKDSYRGLGVERGLEVLALVKSEIGMPVITDVHAAEEVNKWLLLSIYCKHQLFFADKLTLFRLLQRLGYP